MKSCRENGFLKAYDALQLQGIILERENERERPQITKTHVCRVKKSQKLVNAHLS